MGLRQLSTLPLGYAPTNLADISNYVSGNWGYFSSLNFNYLTKSITTVDGYTFSDFGADNGGISVASKNAYSNSAQGGLILHRLGKKSARRCWFLGDYEKIIMSTNNYIGSSTPATFIPNVTGMAFKFSKQEYSPEGNNTRTECRIQRMGAAYVDGSSSGSTNGRIRYYSFPTTGSGSLSYNAEGIGTNDKFCCYYANQTSRTEIINQKLLFLGFLFDLNFNHNGTGTQDPSGYFWKMRPIITTGGEGNTSKPGLLQGYPFENMLWGDYNPYYSGKIISYNSKPF